MVVGHGEGAVFSNLLISSQSLDYIVVLSLGVGWGRWTKG